jgi:hypothetical protein
MTRFNQVGTIIGKRGTGKSLFVLGSKYSAKAEDQRLNISGLFDTQIKNGFKVFIVDTLDHPLYRKIPIIKPDQISKFKKGICRAFMAPDKIRKLVGYINQTASFNNSFIIFEDAGKYTESKLPIEFKRLIADSKQRNIDILFIYHCWADTPLDVFRKGLDYIQLFKTEDKPLVRKNNLNLYELIEQTHTRINNNPNRFYTELIDTSTN